MHNTVTGKSIIVGAGAAGNLLIENLHREGIGWDIIGFIDDAQTKRTDTALPVLGTVDKLPLMIDQLHIKNVIIAAPSQHGAFVRRVVRTLAENTSVALWVIPRAADIIYNARVSYADVRPIEPQDIIGEAINKADQLKLEGEFAGKTVAITGGAGSIGSELSKQVFLLKPKRLIVIDAAESPLFHVENTLNNLSALNTITQTEYILGTIHNQSLMYRVFRHNAVDIVFHAAAYKHVPLMEQCVYEGVKNNIAGTHAIARIAGEHGCRQFVLISTDKAARPASVMGMTKRAAEQTVRMLQSAFPSTAYAIVRFGNVFMSNGSAVEIFLDQLRRGKTMTITDPEMTRYFMTIPEAVHLVLYASRGSASNTYTLDMGKPITIMEIAQCLARIAGYRASDIEYKIIGSRPGEKKHEVLFDDETETEQPTDHPRIRRILHRRERPIEAWRNELEQLLALLNKPETRSHSPAGASLLRAQLEKIMKAA